MKLRTLKIVILILCLNLVGCTTAQVINGPDGTPHHLITCDYIKGCYEKATEVCGGKYQIANTSSEVSGSAQITTSSTNLLVKCQK